MADYTQDLPPELAAEQMQIQRRRQLAEALMAQSQRQQPIQHWTQGAAQLANAYLGKKKLDEADAAQKQLGQQYQQGQSAELDKVKAAMMPQPAITLPEGEAGPARPEMPAPQEKVRQAMIAAQMSNYPQVRQFGQGQQKFVEQDQARTDAATLRKDLLSDSEAARQATARENAAARASEAALHDRRAAEAAAAQARLVASLRPPKEAPAPVVLTDPAGNVTLVDHSGNVIKKMDGAGKPSGNFTKADSSRKKSVMDLDQSITELEKATKDGGLIDQSTGSGAGALFDAGASFFGKATPGSIAVGQMKPIFDLALKQVPRFEGPQSDKDTASYKEAAGDLANPNVPNARKKAAGLEMLRLMKARRGQFVPSDIAGTEADTPTAPSAGGLSPQEQAELSALRKRFGK